MLGNFALTEVMEAEMNCMGYGFLVKQPSGPSTSHVQSVTLIRVKRQLIGVDNNFSVLHHGHGWGSDHNFDDYA